MRKRNLVLVCLSVLPVALALYAQTPANSKKTTAAVSVPPTTASPAPSPSAQKKLIDTYCVSCHNEDDRVANLLLDKMDLGHVNSDQEQWEKVVVKLRAGMMPPSGSPRPDASSYKSMIAWLENELDRNAVLHVPAPGLHRLNRTEYANAIRDLVGIEIDASKMLPTDDSSYGFDNMAGTLGTSPALLEAYMLAATKISRMVVGDVTASSQVVYKAPEDTSQEYHIPSLPFGTRGGLLVPHEFPANGEYTLRVILVNGGNMAANGVFGVTRGERLEILIDGERVHLGNAVLSTEVHVPVKAGMHMIAATFPATQYAPNLDMNEHFLRSTLETDPFLRAYTFLPQVGGIRVDGPFQPAGAPDSASRRKVFVCTPATAAEEKPCAQKIITGLVGRAFRRPSTAADVASFMRFYEDGRSQKDFDRGIEVALRRILADPQFVFRIEEESDRPRRINNIELASRLSFFLWSTGPDSELMALASQGKLRDTSVLDQQVRRMLADPRSEALAVNFAGQWLDLRGMQRVGPLPQSYPDFDDNLRYAMRREAELFFDSIVREDRSVTELLTADFTFLNERLARHYGIPGIYGSQFRRVTLGPEFDVRRGLLGKAAILTTTSQAARTSPVQRGKWILTNLIGVAPPKPPMAFDLKPAKVDGSSHVLTMRERMEQHRSDPYCASCHKLMDPIGFSLENFDAIGTWRTQDELTPINSSDVFYDGTKVDGVAGLRQILVKYQDQFTQTMAEKLLTYALGRGLDYQDMPVVRSIARESSIDKNRFSALVLAIVRSTPFQMNGRAE